VGGSLLLNGQSGPEMKSKMKNSAYIMQDDILLNTQTPREILEFAANLRIPNTFSGQEKVDRVNIILKELNLVNCQNTRVGAPGIKRGISGGERKRVAIGAEIVDNPSLLFGTN
jgi:ABC-type multidrug transport system ATPase subunit